MACTYSILNDAGERVSFEKPEDALKYARDNNLADKLVKGDPDNTTATLANILRQMAFGEINYNPQQMRVFQDEILDEFIRLEEQSGFFYKIGSAVALTKGLGKSFDQVNNVKKNLFELGIDNPKAFEELNVPFDARYLLTGDSKYKAQNSDPYYHKITAGNISRMNEVVALSKTIFMEQTPEFKDTYSKVIANLKSTLSTEKMREIADDLTAYYQIAAYKQWIIASDQKTSTLRNSLIYDSSNPNRATETIVEIIKEAISIDPTNTFLKFILPVNTVVKIGKKQARNVNNKDLINTIEGKTRGKIEPDLIANMMDSFTELYQNPRTRYHAKALFDYLIVKDGLMFKNKSFIKMIPTMMFDNMSTAADMATELLSISTIKEYGRFLKKLGAIQIVDQEGNYKDYFTAAEQQEYNDLFRKGAISEIKDKIYQKVFGKTASQLYSRFEGIYATDQKYQYNLDFIRPKGKKGISIDRSTTNITVKMFTEDFYKAEKGSEERNKIFKDTMKSIGEANFGGVQVDENKTNIIFKKFVRVSEASTSMGDFFEGMPDEKSTPKYKTYQLIQVTREDSNGKFVDYTGTDMTASTDLVPMGVAAIYAPIDVVGTSNSTGVVDLGARPTKDKVLETINDRIIREEQPTPIPMSVTDISVKGISFREDNSSGYKERTIKNASADATIAIATDFNSAGEKLTASTVKAQQRKYIPVDANSLEISSTRVDGIVSSLNLLANTTISLNIAGNGIYTMKGKYTQQQVDDFTYNLIKAIIESPNLTRKIGSIRTGGQTGFDEAGAKAGMKLGIPTSILAPKGWKFRDINGNDISDEKAFKSRFVNVAPIAEQGSLFSAPEAPPTPTETPSAGIVASGMFGGLAMMDFDPNDMPTDDFYISEQEINDAKNKKDKC